VADTPTGTAKLVLDLFNSANASRKKHEMRWYIGDNFLENNHFLKALNQLGQLEQIKFPTGIQIRPIPRAKKQIKSMVNLVLSNDPRWNIYPRPTIDLKKDPNAMAQYDETVRRLGQWFDDLWYFLDLKDQIRKLVTYGYKYNVGYIEIGGDPEGNIFCDAYEPYDIWHESGISELKETSFLIKGVSRTLQYIKNVKGQDSQPLYDPNATAQLKAESRLALSDWKNIRLLEQNKGATKGIEDERIARVFLKECWVKDGEEWTLVTESQGKTLREAKTGLKDLPFAAYSPQEGLLYQASELEDLIPMNKGIDIQAAMLEGYARTVAVARLLKQKMTKVTRSIGENGEIIEWEGAQPPVWLEPSAAPSSSVQVLQIYRDLMDEIGTSVVSFGKVPRGVKAAAALEQLKNVEYANAQTPIDRLAKTLEEVAEKILDTGSRYFTEPVTIPHVTDGKPDPFQLVGENSVASFNEQSGAIPISAQYMVKVEIESGVAYTEEGKRDAIMQLWNAKLLPAEEVLKAFKYSNVSDIIARLQEEQAQQTSIVQTPEFKNLPPQLRLQILQSLGVNVSGDVSAKIPLALLSGGAPAAPATPPAPPVPQG